jgi:hypothetical protein
MCVRLYSWIESPEQDVVVIYLYNNLKQYSLMRSCVEQ